MRLTWRHKRRIIIDLSREEATQLAKELLEWDPEDLGVQETRIIHHLHEIMPELYDLE